jgi:hypothetical protein
MSEIKIVLYAENIDSGVQPIQKLIQKLVSEKNIKICRSISYLSQCLDQFPGENLLVVLLAADSKDLNALLAISDRFVDNRPILILPDAKGKTIKVGHMMHPRFLSYADSNLKELEAVLGKIMSQS